MSEVRRPPDAHRRPVRVAVGCVHHLLGLRAFQRRCCRRFLRTVGAGIRQPRDPASRTDRTNGRDRFQFARGRRVGRGPDTRLAGGLENQVEQDRGGTCPRRRTGAAPRRDHARPRARRVGPTGTVICRLQNSPSSHAPVSAALLEMSAAERTLSSPLRQMPAEEQLECGSILHIGTAQFAHPPFSDITNEAFE